MNITKLGHCCLVIETAGKVILTDPGAFTTEQNNVTGIDIVLITHEHADHFHIESLKQVLQNNPQAVVVTSAGVGKFLDEASIPYATIEDEQELTDLGVHLQGVGYDHAVIYPSIPSVINVGFVIDKQLLLAGDAFPEFPQSIDIVAMPIAGPWMKISEAIDWVKSIKPKIVIPVHDAILSNPQWFYTTPSKILAEDGIQFDALTVGDQRHIE